MELKAKAVRYFAAGSGLSQALEVPLGVLSQPEALTYEGNGSADYSAPLAAVVKYDGVTGVQTLDLGAVPSPFGGTIDFAAVREVVVRNKATNAAHLLKARPAAASGFAGALTVSGMDTPTLNVQPGTAGVYASKPLGTPQDTTSGRVIELDFGANTFSAEVVIRGNA